MRTRRHRSWSIALVLATGLLVAVMARPAHAASYPVEYSLLAARSAAFAPDTPPPGANIWSCRPTAAHPRPVVLVHGTFSNEDENWASLSPLLADNGYCVYTFNYGGPPLLGAIYALGDIPTSAGELATFVKQVLAATHATKVDLVGHSQGGMMPRYYLKFLGGAAKVQNLVGLAPSNHGTTLFGLTTLLGLFTGGAGGSQSPAGCAALPASRRRARRSSPNSTRAATP